MTSSCQNIDKRNISSSSQSLGGGSLRNNGGGSHYINGTGSLGRLKYHHKHKSVEASNEELDYSQLSQSTHILGRVKSDRFLASQRDEDRRRRTIIVSKKKDSYGFTLQSYGIHYKKDQEVEMITYVDYVEYDGPAYKAGMREGDVILSINSTNLEKADHKTLVDFIKSCDGCMRMVVLFGDCVRKVELHMRYIQLQNILHNKMNELERICLRERELLEGKWKTHSLPARKKATTSPTDAELSGLSPNGDDDGAQNVTCYRSTLSTEDVPNNARHQTPQTIIPPPAQFMLTYHYLDPNYRYILKPSTSNSSGDYFVSIGSDDLQRSPTDQHFILTHTESVDTSVGGGGTLQRNAALTAGARQPPVPPPRTCEKHKPPNKQQQMQQQQQQQQKKAESTPPKSQKSGKHCHGQSCNPCIGHFKWKSAEKAAAAATGNGGGDNVSLDAYDLASPCCDTHCVPSRRRTRHKEHTHKHKHRDRERDSKERPPRPKSQPHATSPGTNARHVHQHHHHHRLGTPDVATYQLQYQQQPQLQHLHHHHHQQQQQIQQQQQLKHGCDSHNGSMRSRYFDLPTGLASHCSLHSCTSSDFAPADSTSYTTSLSTDTLYWDPKSDNVASRQHSTKSRQSYQQHPQQSQTQQQLQQLSNQPEQTHAQYQQRYHITATQIQPSQIYPNTAAYVHKPKSWDNLTTKAIGGYGFGYGYLDTVAVKPAIKLQIAQQRHSMPRKNPYGRYSTYADTDVENYAPPPSQFVEELITTTTTTKITAKSTEEVISAPTMTTSDCLTKQQQQQQQHAIKAAQYQINQTQKLLHHNSCQMGGYYSHLPRPTTDVGTSTVTPSYGGIGGGAGVGAGAGGANTDIAAASEVTRL